MTDAIFKDDYQLETPLKASDIVTIEWRFFNPEGKVFRKGMTSLEYGKIHKMGGPYWSNRSLDQLKKTGRYEYTDAEGNRYVYEAVKIGPKDKDEK